MEEFIINFYEILEDTELHEVNENTAYKSLDEWDSMTTLMFIAMVDEKYHKQVNGKDIEESATLKDLYTRVKSK